MGSTPSSTTSPTNEPQGDHNWGVSGSTGGNLDPEANHQGAFGAGNNAHIGSGSKNPTFGTFTADQQPMMSDATPASGLFQNRARADVSPHLPAGDGTSHTSSTAPQKLHVAAITPKDKASADGPAWNSPFSQGEEQPENSPQGGLFPSSQPTATPMRLRKNTNNNESLQHLATPVTTAGGGGPTANLVSPMPDQILPSPVAANANPNDPMGPPPPRLPAATPAEPISFQQQQPKNDVLPKNDVVVDASAGSPGEEESFQDMHMAFEQYLRDTDDKQQSFAETLLDATVEVDMVTAELLECYSAAIHFSHDLESIQAELADKIRVLKMMYHHPEEVDLTSETDDETDDDVVDK